MITNQSLLRRIARFETLIANIQDVLATFTNAQYDSPRGQRLHDKLVQYHQDANIYRNLID